MSRVAKVSLTVAAGEIVGVAGVAGNGQSELLEALAGMRRPVLGTIRLDGRRLSPQEQHPHELRRLGLLHVPEDRLRTGLVPSFPAFESAALGFTDDPAFGDGPLLDHRRMVADLAGKMSGYDIRPPAPRLETRKFSGGNQQKMVLAREIERRPKVLIVGQPTRGVDIGAIEFIHGRLRAMRDAGDAVLVVSSELDEILALADRVIVMGGGRVTGDLPIDACAEATLGRMMGGAAHEVAPEATPA